VDFPAAAVTDLQKRVQMTRLIGKKIMPFEVKACSIEDMHRHPVLRDRSVARVKITLRLWAFSDYFSAPAAVSAVRMSLNPFETKRNFYAHQAG